LAERDFVVGAPVSLPLPLDERDWAVLRITDRARPADPRAEGLADYRSAGRTVAYLSPFFIAARATSPRG
jgi:hypothetical protein